MKDGETLPCPAVAPPWPLLAASCILHPCQLSFLQPRPSLATAPPASRPCSFVPSLLS